MKVAGEYRFKAPREAVWEALLDPEVLAATLPGCDSLDLVGENTYEGTLNMKVGPVQGRFQGKVQLEDLSPPSGYKMTIDGRGAPGFVKATAQVELEEQSDETLLRYDSDAQVGGRIASVGQRLLDSSAKAIIQQSLEGLERTIAARGDAEATGDEGEGAPVEQPSQTEFAAKVAKEVAKDLVPAPFIITAIVIILLVLLFLMFT